MKRSLAIVGVLCALTTIVTSTGCRASSATPADLSALPATWQARRPFRSADAIVLAHDEAEASAAGGLAAEVAADFHRRTGRAPSPRLLVIVGSADWLADRDPCLRLRLAAMGDAILDGRPEPPNADLVRQCDELREKSAKVGLDPATLLTLRPTVLASDGFQTQLGLPAAASAAFDWAIAMATDAELAAAVHAMLAAAMAREELNVAQQLLLAPMLPWLRGKAVDAARGEIKRTLFALHASAQDDWTPDERRSVVDAYARDLGVELEAGGRTALLPGN